MNLLKKQESTLFNKNYVPISSKIVKMMNIIKKDKSLINNTEKVILLNDLSHLKEIDKDVSRIYFGNEFCDFLIPSIKEIEMLLKFKESQNIEFSIVTPYTNQRNLLRIYKILNYLNKTVPSTEIIVNDWGVLNLVKDHFKNLSIVLGRIMSRQKRGFFIKDKNNENVLIDNMNLKKSDREYLKYSILQNDYLINFIKSIGIKRIGLDNVKQGAILRNQNIAIDLYYPYIYITTSNYCLTSSLYNHKGVIKKINRCNNICKRVNTRKIEICGGYIYLAGNTQFCFNDQFSNVDLKKINRLVRTVL